MYTVYKIENSSSLSEIANMLGIDISILSNLNGISSDAYLTEGSYIIIPKSSSENFITYMVKPGDTIIEIARQNGIDYRQLLSLNGLDKDQYIYPNQEILIPNKNVYFWITGAEDTLEEVANKFGTNSSVIVSQNKSIYLKPEQLIIYKKEM